LNSGFTIIPNDTLRRRDLKPVTKIVYAIIVSHANSDGESWPGVNLICEEAGISKPTALKAQAELAAAGLIKKMKRGRWLITGMTKGKRILPNETGCEGKETLPNGEKGKETLPNDNDERSKNFTGKVKILYRKGKNSLPPTEEEPEEEPEQDLSCADTPARQGLSTKRKSPPPYWQIPTNGSPEDYAARASAALNRLFHDKGNDWAEAYPAMGGIDGVRQEMAQAREWLEANPSQRKTNLKRFVVNWLKRSQERGGGNRSRASPRYRTAEDDVRDAVREAGIEIP